jgi:beta-glucosidase
MRKSLVLLKNDNQALPLAKDTPLVFVAGQGANDIDMQCGGWTIEWQGKSGNITPGTTILGTVQKAVSAGTVVQYDRFDHMQATGPRAPLFPLGYGLDTNGVQLP